MTLKKTMTALALVLVFAGTAQAQEAPAGDNKFSATVGAVSQYRFRGITQSDERPALQGSVDWSHSSGIYAGVWASNVDFNDGDEASVEVDVYGGYKFAYQGLDLNMGAVGYVYPGASSNLNYNYYELLASASHDFGGATVSASFNYSPNNFGDSGNAEYLGLGATVPIMDSGISFVSSWGHQWIDDESAYGYPDYSDWSAGFTYNFRGIDLSLKYVDTSLSNADCADGCDAAGIFSISKTFP